MAKLKEGQTITINIPFTYTIGDEGIHTCRKLQHLADCLHEIRAELDEGVLDDNEVLAEFEGNTYIL